MEAPQIRVLFWKCNTGDAWRNLPEPLPSDFHFDGNR